MSGRVGEPVKGRGDWRQLSRSPRLPISPSKEGLTLVELLVVLAIIAVVATISIPTIASMTSPKNALRKEGRKVMQLMAEARTLAMARKAKVNLYVDTALREVRMVEAAAYRPVSEQDSSMRHADESTNQYEKVIVFDEGFELGSFTADEIEVAEKEGDPFGKSGGLPAYGTDESTEKLAVSFTHFGGSDGGGISLTKDSVQLDIAADILTGRPKIVKRTGLLD